MIVGVIAAIIVILVLAIIAFSMGLFSFGRIEGGLTPALSPPPSGFPQPSITPTASTPLPTINLPILTATPTPTSSTPATGVNFNIAITSVSGSGLSRTITAQVSNTGNADAHNVWIKVELFSGQQRISINGKDYLRVDVGTLAANTTVTKEAALSVSIFDGLRIMQNGGTFQLTIYSDERTQTLSYNYKA